MALEESLYLNLMLLPDDFSRGLCTAAGGINSLTALWALLCCSCCVPSDLPHDWSGTINTLSGGSGSCACVIVSRVFLRGLLILHHTKAPVEQIIRSKIVGLYVDYLLWILWLFPPSTNILPFSFGRSDQYEARGLVLNISLVSYFRFVHFSTS